METLKNYPEVVEQSQRLVSSIIALTQAISNDKVYKTKALCHKVRMHAIALDNIAARTIPKKYVAQKKS